MKMSLELLFRHIPIFDRNSCGGPNVTGLQFVGESISHSERLEIPGLYQDVPGEPRPHLHSLLARVVETRGKVAHRDGLRARRLAMVDMEGGVHHFVSLRSPDVAAVQVRVHSLALFLSCIFLC